MPVVINGSTGISTPDGTAGVPSHTGTSGSTNGLYFPTATSAAISTNGLQAIAIDSSQNTTCKGSLTVGTQSSTQGTFVLTNTNVGNYPTTIKSSNSVSAAWTMTLPISAGTNGYPLTTDGSGNTAWSLLSMVGGGTSVATSPFSPGGRLTFASGIVSPNNTSYTGITTIYYDTFVHPFVPIYNGTTWSLLQITANEISLALTSNSGFTGYQAAGSMYDVYIINNGGIALATGVAWTSTTNRGSGAGTAAVVLKDGIWTNANSMTMRFGNAAGNTVTVAANQGTLIGTMYATSNGTTQCMFGVNSGVGGANNIIGLCNAYNRVPFTSINQDGTGTYTYNSTTVRNIANSANNRISWVDCFGGNAVSGILLNTMAPSTGNPTVGLSLNASGSSGVITGLGAQLYSPADASIRILACAQAVCSGIGGFNYLQGIEYDGNTNVYTGNFGAPGITLYGLM